MSLMQSGSQTVPRRWLAGVCVLLLLVGGFAGAIHVCDFSNVVPLSGFTASSSGSTSHDFCAICSLAHSPSLTPVQVTVAPVFDRLADLAVPAVVYTTILQAFALSIRPPPAS